MQRWFRTLLSLSLVSFTLATIGCDGGSAPASLPEKEQKQQEDMMNKYNKPAKK